jgi:hypothetical protein
MASCWLRMVCSRSAEQHLHEGGQPLDRRGRVLGRLQRQAPRDGRHQRLVGGQEDAQVEPRATVELAQPGALLDVVAAVLAGHQRGEVLVLEPARLGQQVRAPEQLAGAVHSRQLIEERAGVLGAVVQHGVLRLGD